MRGIRSKAGTLLQNELIQIAISLFIVVLFFVATAQKLDSRYVRQQVIEKQLALFLDSADSGMDVYIEREYEAGVVQAVSVADGRVFVQLDGLSSLVGYPYYSTHSVEVLESEKHFILSVR